MGPKMPQRWDPKMGPPNASKRRKNGPRNATKCPKNATKWIRNGPKNGPQNGPQKCFKMP